MSQESEEFRLEMDTWEMLDVNCIRTRKLDEIDKEANSDGQKFKGPPYLEERKHTLCFQVTEFNINYF